MWLGVHHARWLSNQSDERAGIVYEEHRATFLAIEAGDPQRARAAAQRHLLNSGARQGIVLNEAFLARIA